MLAGREQLRKIVGIHETRVQSAKSRLKAGVASSGEVADVEIQLLEARIRLAEEMQRKR